jgi:hypothetical protein
VKGPAGPPPGECRRKPRQTAGFSFWGGFLGEAPGLQPSRRPGSPAGRKAARAAGRPRGRAAERPESRESDSRAGVSGIGAGRYRVNEAVPYPVNWAGLYRVNWAGPYPVNWAGLYTVNGDPALPESGRAGIRKTGTPSCRPRPAGRRDRPGGDGDVHGCRTRLRGRPESVIKSGSGRVREVSGPARGLPGGPPPQPPDEGLSLPAPPRPAAAFTAAPGRPAAAGTLADAGHKEYIYPAVNGTRATLRRPAPDRRGSLPGS